MPISPWYADSVVVMVGTSLFAAFTAVSCSKKKEASVAEQTMQMSDPMVISGANENGVSVMKTMLRSGEYEDYGVAATAESAYVLTASGLARKPPFFLPLSR